MNLTSFDQNKKKNLKHLFDQKKPKTFEKKHESDPKKNKLT